MRSPVLATLPANSSDALAHFKALLQFETDCWDVHYSIEQGLQDFVLLDVRNQELFDKGHINGAVNLPHNQINTENLKAFEGAKLFVVYCAGPHCNGTEKAAIKLAKLNLPVKKMIGGVTGWLDEGFTLKSS